MFQARGRESVGLCCLWQLCADADSSKGSCRLVMQSTDKVDRVILVAGDTAQFGIELRDALCLWILPVCRLLGRFVALFHTSCWDDRAAVAITRVEQRDARSMRL